MIKEIKTSEGTVTYCPATCEVHLDGQFKGLAMNSREAVQIVLDRDPWKPVRSLLYPNH